MDVQQLDAIVRTAGVTLLLVLAAMLGRDRRSRRLAMAFAPLAICLSGFLIWNTPEPSLRLHGALAAVAHLASGYAAPFMWWFCLASFDAMFQPRGPVLGAGLAWFAIASADRGLMGPQAADKGLSWVLVAMGFGMIAHLAWRLIRDREGDLLERRRAARVVVVVLLAGMMFVELSKEVIFGIDWRPHAYTIAQDAVILAFVLTLLGEVLGVIAEAPAAEAGAVIGPTAWDPIAATGQDQDVARLTERLKTLIEVEQAHLDPALTFDAFVRRMGAPERVVRRHINHRLGHDHFRAFLNVFRIAEARRLLADPSRSGDKLIAIALDSGFASLASFNRVFRASEGCPPSAYRDACQSAGESPSGLAPLAPGFEERSAAF